MIIFIMGSLLTLFSNAQNSYDDCKSRDFQGEACMTQRAFVNFCKDVTKDDSKCERK
jgi:hypothetical protein